MRWWRWRWRANKECCVTEGHRSEWGWALVLVTSRHKNLPWPGARPLSPHVSRDTCQAWPPLQWLPGPSFLLLVIYISTYLYIYISTYLHWVTR